jgi:hypothetical protein
LAYNRSLFRRAHGHDFRAAVGTAEHAPQLDRSASAAFAHPTFCTLIMILEPLGQFVDVLGRPAGHFHAEVEAHLGQHFLDLVQ